MWYFGGNCHRFFKGSSQCLQFCYLLSWSGGHCRLRSTSYKACTSSLCPPLCSWFTVNWIIRCQCTAHPVRYLGRDISETSRVSVSLQTSITAVYIIHPLLLATALCFYKALSTFSFLLSHLLNAGVSLQTTGFIVNIISVL